MLFWSVVMIIFIPVTIVIGYVPKVNTPKGVVVGYHRKSYNGRTFMAFEGIPYAKKPIGQLRFEEPQAAEPWSGVVYANETYICMQFNPYPVMSGVIGTEDCLYIYIYVPRKELNANDKLLDVVIHIHGGAFTIGSPVVMAEPDYMMDRDVVYVTLNYRLGLLGFLSTDDDVVPGNMGLKDQRLALQWIKDNIRYFGGNPESITLTGLSAGAVSVHYHYLSPLSKGLFNRGFSQSGTCLQSWGLAKKPMKMTKKIAKELNCDHSTTKEIISCLKQIKDKKLVDAVSKLFIFASSMPFSPFAPVVEKSSNNAFLAENPIKLLSEGNLANDVPWVTSNTADEGLFAIGVIAVFGKLAELGKRWNEVSQYVLDFYNTVDDNKKIEVSQKMKNFYGISDDISVKNVTGLTKLLSDRLFYKDTEKAIRLHAKLSKSPIYYFKFSYNLEQESLFGKALPVAGSQHSDDGKLMFKMFNAPDKLSKTDEKAKDLLIDFIYDYATTGKVKLGGVELKQLQVGNEIDFVDIRPNLQIEEKRVAELAPKEFWNSLPVME